MLRCAGLNPVWQETFEFQLEFPELALLHVTVKDDNMTGKDAMLGTYALPVTSMQQGECGPTK